MASLIGETSGYRAAALTIAADASATIAIRRIGGQTPSFSLWDIALRTVSSGLIPLRLPTAGVTESFAHLASPRYGADPWMWQDDVGVDTDDRELGQG